METPGNGERADTHFFSFADVAERIGDEDALRRVCAMLRKHHFYFFLLALMYLISHDADKIRCKLMFVEKILDERTLSRGNNDQAVFLREEPYDCIHTGNQRAVLLQFRDIVVPKVLVPAQLGMYVPGV